MTHKNDDPAQVLRLLGPATPARRYCYHAPPASTKENYETKLSVTLKMSPTDHIYLQFRMLEGENSLKMLH